MLPAVPRANAVLLVLALATGLVSAVPRQDAREGQPIPWRELFNGKDLDGWTLAPHNGAAPFRCVDGALVGTTRKGEPISYLVADSLLGDFVLELEFLVPRGMNTGIQVRSHGFPDCMRGQFHGYQVEISSGRWTGGVFDEARRGWLCPLQDRPDLGGAFLPFEWNQLRVEAVGDRIRTWVNGLAAADCRDGMTPMGYVAIQLHDSLHRSGEQIRFRNIRVQDLDRQPGTRPQDPFLGSWKGVTSNYSKGLYAEIDRDDGRYRARLFDDPRDRERPLATLSGTVAGGRLELIGDGWTGHVRDGIFSGQGRQRALRPIGQGRHFEETDSVIPVSFVMMPGVFRTSASR